MKPTLLVGDFVIVGKLDRAPERGDVVTFRHPLNGRDYIKRVIGLPGDRIQLKSSVLYIDDAPIDRFVQPDFEEIMAPQGPAKSLPRCANAPVALGDRCLKKRFTETLPNGRQYDVLEIGDGVLDNTGAFTVPDGHLFVLGDNRDNSADSRIPDTAGGMGFVPVENVTGTARWVLFSSAGPSLLSLPDWREDRFLRRVE